MFKDAGTPSPAHVVFPVTFHREAPHAPLFAPVRLPIGPRPCSSRPSSPPLTVCPESRPWRRRQITKPTFTDVEVRCVDDSVVKLKLLDDRLDVITKYGKLEIPAGDIRRIEFATRVTPEVAERITLLHLEFESSRLRDRRESDGRTSR